MRIAGKDVGKVEGFRRGPGHTTVVVMRIDDAGRPGPRGRGRADPPARLPRGRLHGRPVAGQPERAEELPEDGTIPLAPDRRARPVHRPAVGLRPARAREPDQHARHVRARARPRRRAAACARLAPELRPLLRDTRVDRAGRAGHASPATCRGRSGATNRIAGALAASPEQLGASIDHLATVTEALRSRDAELARDDRRAARAARLGARGARHARRRAAGRRARGGAAHARAAGSRRSRCASG